MRKALAVYRKELRQILRDRRTLLILVFIPAFFLLLYGYALNFDIRHIKLAVEDRDGTPESRAVVSGFVNSSYFDLVATVHSPAAAERLLDLNEARAVLVIPEGFGRDLELRAHGGRASRHRRRQRQHRDDDNGVRGEHPAHGRRRAGAGPASGATRRSPSSRASGTTRSSAARSSWCRA